MKPNPKILTAIMLTFDYPQPAASHEMYINTRVLIVKRVFQVTFLEESCK